MSVNGVPPEQNTENRPTSPPPPKVVKRAVPKIKSDKIKKRDNNNLEDYLILGMFAQIL